MTDARGDRLSRRSVLAGGGLLLVAACTGGSAPVVVPRLTADQRVARRVADEITVLEAAYAATVAAHPSTRRALGPLAAEHQAHVAALVELLPAPTATPSGSATPIGSASPSSASPSAAPPPVVPASTADALSALAAAERAAASQRRGQAGHAGPELARLLASIAACESVHATLVGK